MRCGSMTDASSKMASSESSSVFGACVWNARCRPSGLFGFDEAVDERGEILSSDARVLIVEATIGDHVPSDRLILWFAKTKAINGNDLSVASRTLPTLSHPDNELIIHRLAIGQAP